MKRMGICWRCIRTTLAKIHLVDKFLLVFMILLLIQSTLNLFLGQAAAGEAGNIDVIIRTSTAAIFGYFLSTNFIRNASSNSARRSGTVVKHISSASSSNAHLKIGFGISDPDALTEQSHIGEAGTVEDSGTDEPMSCQLQIITASVIGLFCLIVLMILRNMPTLSGDVATSSIATVSQFRDIVSGCIGFLIGSPTSSTNNAD